MVDGVHLSKGLGLFGMEGKFNGMGFIKAADFKPSNDPQALAKIIT